MSDTQSIAAANMFDLMNQLSIIGQNVTNANTPAYKSLSSFEDALGAEHALNSVGESRKSYTQVDFSQGSLTATGRPLDIALTGPGFFVIESNGHQYLSRLGNLSVNAKGLLTDSNGATVMGQQGPVFLENEDIQVHPDGQITHNDTEIDQLLIVSVDNPNAISIASNGYYIYPGKLESSNNRIQVLQGFLESSNVDVASETIKMIEMMRKFEMQQKILKTNDAMIGTGMTILGEF